VVADDQQLVRTGLRMILNAEPDIEVVGVATDGRSAITVCAELTPDVVLMDVRMPEVDGIEAIGARKSTEPPRNLERPAASAITAPSLRQRELSLPLAKSNAGETLGTLVSIRDGDNKRCQLPALAGPQSGLGVGHLRLPPAMAARSDYPAVTSSGLPTGVGPTRRACAVADLGVASRARRGRSTYR
jgi:CheY-like chemotaxis protein